MQYSDDFNFILFYSSVENNVLTNLEAKYFVINFRIVFS